MIFQDDTVNFSFVYSISTLQGTLGKMLPVLYIRRKTQFPTVHIFYFYIFFKELLHSQAFWNDSSKPVTLFMSMYVFHGKKKNFVI